MRSHQGDADSATPTNVTGWSCHCGMQILGCAGRPHFCGKNHHYELSVVLALPTTFNRPLGAAPPWSCYHHLARHPQPLPAPRCGRPLPSTPADRHDSSEPPLSLHRTPGLFNVVVATPTKALQHLASFAFAWMQTKPDPKKPDGRLTMCYGSIRFKDAKGAKKLLGNIQAFVLDSHALHVKFAGHGQEREVLTG